jgi:hypothetical protein
LYDSNPSLLDDSESKFFSEFLDGLMMGNLNDQIDTSLKSNDSFQLQDPRLQSNQLKGYAALGISNTGAKKAPPKKRGPGRPRKNEKPELADDEVENDEPKKSQKRDLLTEHEKRQNHVVSEQKRRKLIRDGFQVLVDLTPALSSSPPISTGPGNTGGGHSKSTVLFKAADYITELKQQVAELQRQLQSQYEPISLSKSSPNIQQIQLTPDQSNNIQKVVKEPIRSDNDKIINSQPKLAHNQSQYYRNIPNQSFHGSFCFPPPPSFLADHTYNYQKFNGNYAGMVQPSFLATPKTTVDQSTERSDGPVPGVA